MLSVVSVCLRAETFANLAQVHELCRLRTRTISVPFLISFVGKRNQSVSARVVQFDHVDELLLKKSMMAMLEFLVREGVEEAATGPRGGSPSSTPDRWILLLICAAASARGMIEPSARCSARRGG